MGGKNGGYPRDSGQETVSPGTPLCGGLKNGGNRPRVHVVTSYSVSCVLRPQRSHLNEVDTPSAYASL